MHAPAPPQPPPSQALASLSRRGFSLIEVMIATLVLAIGVIGVFAMQIVAVQTNSAAHKATEVTAIAEQYIERLRQDATRWTTGTDLSATTYLQSALTTDGWVIITPQPVAGVGASRDSVDGVLANQATLCVAYNLQSAVDGEVLAGWLRVYWPRSGARRDALATCGQGSDAIQVDDLDSPVPATQAIVRRQVGSYTVPFTIRRMTLGDT